MQTATSQQLSMTELLQRMVKTPSRAIDDSPAPMIDLIRNWCEEAQLEYKLIGDLDTPGGVLLRARGKGPGKTVLLNACIDTAGYGNTEDWAEPPTSGLIQNDWLYGRGSADSKAGVVIFLHVIKHLVTHGEFLGEVLAFFDADEHSGHMSGTRQFISSHPAPDYVMIGYPGRDQVCVGARGFFRCRVHIYGRSAHTGTKATSTENAILKASKLISILSQVDFMHLVSDMPPPKLSVTAIQGGGSFALVPDFCTISLDIRLTQNFQVQRARQVVNDAIVQLDNLMPSVRASATEDVVWLPAYHIDAEHELPKALLEAARTRLGKHISPKISGASNVGNMWATVGAPSTCGFGPRFENIHAPNERVYLPDLPTIVEVYIAALTKICGHSHCS